MKILIAYASKHGCTERTALLIQEALRIPADLLNLRNSLSADIDSYDLIIIGGSVHMGKLNHLLSDFTDKYLQMLFRKKVAFFVCFMDSMEKAGNYIKQAIDKQLLEQALSIGYFGGEFNFEKMSPFERLVVKQITKTEQSVSTIDYEKITRFINYINCLS